MNNKNIMSVVITIAVLAVIGWLLIVNEGKKEVAAPVVPVATEVVQEVKPIEETVKPVEAVAE